jgi:hypothetical protein
VLGSQADIASICPHRRADGERGQVGAEPVTSDRVQRSERQVAGWFTAGGLAGGAKDKPGLSGHRPCRHARTPHREVGAPRHEVMDKPDRRARQPDRGKGPAGDDLVHLLDAGHQPGKGTATELAHRTKFRRRHRLPPKRRAAGPLLPLQPRRAEAASLAHRRGKRPALQQIPFLGLTVRSLRG